VYIGPYLDGVLCRLGLRNEAAEASVHDVLPPEAGHPAAVHVVGDVTGGEQRLDQVLPVVQWGLGLGSCVSVVGMCAAAGTADVLAGAGVQWLWRT
jgi:hypothetical protein